MRAFDIWCAAYLQGLEAPARQPPTDVFFCICDHFEPMHRASKTVALQRLQRWKRDYPALAASITENGGSAPKHTFFYPIEQYDRELLAPLAELCARHGCEVEVHLHHENDTADSLNVQLAQGIADLRSHGFLGSIANGKPAFGFIHGNWALDDSHPRGRACGVRGELAILKKAGCFGDFTMPSAPSRTQTRIINSVYHAQSTDRGKSHDKGIPVERGETARLRKSDEHLLMIQGILTLNWKRRKWGILPRIENSDLCASNPANKTRLELWLANAPAVKNQPGWRFIKLHTHGAVEANTDILLGTAMQGFHRHLNRRVESAGANLHYVTAREMVNLIHAAEDGAGGDPHLLRNYSISPPPLLE